MKCKITGCKNKSTFETILFQTIFNNELCEECMNLLIKLVMVYLYENQKINTRR